MKKKIHYEGYIFIYLCICIYIYIYMCVCVCVCKYINKNDLFDESTVPVTDLTNFDNVTLAITHFMFTSQGLLTVIIITVSDNNNWLTFYIFLYDDSIIRFPACSCLKFKLCLWHSVFFAESFRFLSILSIDSFNRHNNRMIWILWTICDKYFTDHLRKIIYRYLTKQANIQYFNRYKMQGNKILSDLIRTLPEKAKVCYTMLVSHYVDNYFVTILVSSTI